MRAAAESDIVSISPVIYVTISIEVLEPEENQTTLRTIQEIFNFFSSVLKPFLPSWKDLIREGVFSKMAERLNELQIRFIDNSDIGARTYLVSEGSFTIDIGTQGLLESWSDQQKQHSRLRKIQGCLLTNLPMHTCDFFGEQDLLIQRWIFLSLEKRGALQEDLCDVIGVACLHRMRKEPEEVYSPSVNSPF